MFKTEYLPTPILLSIIVLFSSGWVILPPSPSPSRCRGMNLLAHALPALYAADAFHTLNPPTTHKSYP